MSHKIIICTIRDGFCTVCTIWGSSDTSDGIDGSIYFQRNAFYETGVKSIYLPSGLKEIVMYSFYISEKNTLKSIKVSKENPYYLSVNGILFSKKPLKVLCIPGAYYLE